MYINIPLSPCLIMLKLLLNREFLFVWGPKHFVTICLFSLCETLSKALKSYAANFPLHLWGVLHKVKEMSCLLSRQWSKSRWCWRYNLAQQSGWWRGEQPSTQQHVPKKLYHDFYSPHGCSAGNTGDKINPCSVIQSEWYSLLNYLINTVAHSERLSKPMSHKDWNCWEGRTPSWLLTTSRSVSSELCLFLLCPLSSAVVSRLPQRNPSEETEVNLQLSQRS